MGDRGAEDERQSRRQDGLLVGLRDHPGISDDRDVGKLMGGLEELSTGSIVVVWALLPSNI
jgi:hypothetical protein